jgi:hypothetical protein
LVYVLGGKIVPDTAKELDFPQNLVIIFIICVVFASLHIFAYTGSLQYFVLGYFISAFIVRAIFSVMFFWRSFLPAVIAHWVYNTLIIVDQSTAVISTSYFWILGFVIMVLSGLYILLDREIGN